MTWFTPVLERRRWMEWKQRTMKDTQLTLFNDRCLTDRIPQTSPCSYSHTPTHSHCGRMSRLLLLVNQSSLRGAEGLLEAEQFGILFTSLTLSVRARTFSPQHNSLKTLWTLNQSFFLIFFLISCFIREHDSLFFALF